MAGEGDAFILLIVSIFLVQLAESSIRINASCTSSLVFSLRRRLGSSQDVVLTFALTSC